MPGRPRRSARLLLHTRPEVLEALLRDVDVGMWEGAGPLLQGMEEYEEIPGPLVQDPVEVPPVVAPQFPELAVTWELRGKGSGGSLLATRLSRLIFEVDLLLPLRGQAVQEVVDGSRPVRVSVVHGLHGVSGTRSGRAGAEAKPGP